MRLTMPSRKSPVGKERNVVSFLTPLLVEESKKLPSLALYFALILNESLLLISIHFLPSPTLPCYADMWCLCKAQCK